MLRYGLNGRVTGCTGRFAGQFWQMVIGGVLRHEKPRMKTCGAVEIGDGWIVTTTGSMFAPRCGTSRVGTRIRSWLHSAFARTVPW